MGVPWNPLCPRDTKTGWTQRLYLSKGGPWVSHGIPCVPGTLRRDGHRDYTLVRGDHGCPMESLVSQGHRDYALVRGQGHGGYNGAGNPIGY